TGEEVQRHGDRDRRQREAARVTYRLQIDRRPVEAEAPAKEREHKGGPNHPPSVETCHWPRPCCDVTLARRNCAKLRQSPNYRGGVGIRLERDLEKIAGTGVGGKRSGAKTDLHIFPKADAVGDRRHARPWTLVDPGVARMALAVDDDVVELYAVRAFQ